MADEISNPELLQLFRNAWVQTDVTSTSDLTTRALRSWLSWTQARAVGWWRREGQSLRMIGFEAAADMPLEVQAAFQEAMRRVSLDKIELGCVRAAAEQRPVVAREDSGNWGLAGSATWLQRFAAQQSLAIPIRRDSTVVGVLAIATAESFEESSANWQRLAALVNGLQEDD